MSRVFTSADGLIPADLIHCGLDHVTAALALFDTNPSHYDSAGYLAHIGVELLLKGWLLEVVGRFEGIHNLGALYQELARHHFAPILGADEAAALNTLDAYEALRYPNRNQPTEVGDDDRAGINALVGHLCRSMPQSIQEALRDVEPGRKAGRILMRKRPT